MKKYFILLFVMLFGITMYAQVDNNIYDVSINYNDFQIEEPELPDISISAWLGKNAKVDVPLEDGEVVCVKVSFVVEKNGTFSKIKVESGNDGQLPEWARAEGMRLVKAMPKLQPARKTNLLLSPKKVREGNVRCRTHFTVTWNNILGYSLRGRSFDIKENGKHINMIDYIARNMKYPKVAEENGIQGRVVLKVLMELDGTVSNAEVIRSVDNSLDEEAIRLAKLLKFTDGISYGHNECSFIYRQYQDIPIMFRL